MRARLNPVAAAIFVVWGAALLISGATGYSPRGAFAFGLILLAVGVTYFVRSNRNTR